MNEENLRKSFNKIKLEMDDLYNQIDKLKKNKPKEEHLHKWRVISKEEGVYKYFLFGQKKIKIITSKCVGCGELKFDKILSPDKIEIKEKIVEVIKEVPVDRIIEKIVPIEKIVEVEKIVKIEVPAKEIQSPVTDLHRTILESDFR